MMYRNILQNLTSSIRQTFLRPYLSINGTFSRFEHSEQDPKNEHLSTQKNERLKRHYQAEVWAMCKLGTISIKITLYEHVLLMICICRLIYGIQQKAIS